MSSAIPFRKLHLAVGIVIDQISKDLIEDRVVSAGNFGTLSPHTRKGHLAHDISTLSVREIPDYRSVKFHPHESFILLLDDREVRFREKA